jgi:hypothetical protein
LDPESGEVEKISKERGMLNDRAMEHEFSSCESRSRTPERVVHAVLNWGHPEVGHWDPAIWRERRWDHSLVWLVAWVSEHRYGWNGVMAESVRCKPYCWSSLTLDVRESHRRHKHAVASRELWWRSCKEYGVRLWAYEVVVRHLMTVGSLAVGMPE